MNWSFKWENHVETKDWKELFKKAVANKSFKYFGYAEKTNSETKQDWIEGYAKTSSKIYKRTIMRSIHASIQWKQMVGGWGANVQFCNAVTQNQLEEMGTRPWNDNTANRGRRTDLAKMVKQLTSGKTLATIVSANPKHARRYSKIMKRVYSLHRAKKPRVLVLYGDMGKDESGLAIQFCKHKDMSYLVQDMDGPTEWMKGYVRQECVILHDFHSQISLEKLVQFMNGSQPEVKMIIVTTIRSLEKWYKASHVDQIDKLKSSIDLYIEREKTTARVVQKSNKEKKRKFLADDVRFINEWCLNDVDVVEVPKPISTTICRIYEVD